MNHAKAIIKIVKNLLSCYCMAIFWLIKWENNWLIMKKDSHWNTKLSNLVVFSLSFIFRKKWEIAERWRGEFPFKAAFPHSRIHSGMCRFSQMDCWAHSSYCHKGTRGLTGSYRLLRGFISSAIHVQTSSSCQLQLFLPWKIQVKKGWVYVTIMPTSRGQKIMMFLNQ